MEYCFSKRSFKFSARKSAGGRRLNVGVDQHTRVRVQGLNRNAPVTGQTTGKDDEPIEQRDVAILRWADTAKLPSAWPGCPDRCRAVPDAATAG